MKFPAPIGWGSPVGSFKAAQKGLEVGLLVEKMANQCVFWIRLFAYQVLFCWFLHTKCIEVFVPFFPQIYHVQHM